MNKKKKYYWYIGKLGIDMRHRKDVGQWEKEYILYKPIEIRYWGNVG